MSEPARPGTLPSGTVTFLFTDIEGSTQRWDRNRAAMEQAVRRHDAIVREAIAERGGSIFKTLGDAFCAAYTTPEAAVSSALEAQRRLAAEDFSGVDGLRVRMAINTGTADERDGDYFGPALNRAARLLALAHGEQVLLTGAAADLMRENPPGDAALVDLGLHALKDFDRKVRVYQLAAPGLRRDFPALRSQAAPWLVPDAMRTRYFTGRDALVTDLRSRLAEHGRAALCGLGGAGKTQTALEYARRFRAEYPEGTFWINAETQAGLTGGFVEIAKALHLPAADSNDQEQSVQAVLRRLNETGGWLLVLDNVEDRDIVRGFVPDHGRGHILLTSRESVFAELGIPRAFEVRDLDGDDAVDFLQKRTGRAAGDPGEDAAAAELAVDLGQLPLALEQAGAYIAETGASFAAYLTSFRKRRLKVLEKSAGLVSRDTVAVTWSANVDAVQRASPASVSILRISALLAPDAIPYDLFLEGAEAMDAPIAAALEDPDDLALGEILRPLARYSLIRMDAGARTFGVHRLVQEIVRTAMPQAERTACLAQAVRALDRALPDGSLSTWPQCERYVPHVSSVAQWLDSSGAESAAAARVFSRAGLYIQRRGRYGEARVLLERALDLRERTPGEGRLDVAQSLSDLAYLSQAQGRYADAMRLHERALAIREAALGPAHLEVAESLNGMAAVHEAEGRQAEALTLSERVLALREAELGADDPLVAASLVNLGSVLVSGASYGKSTALFERALAIQRRAYREDHPDVAASLKQLGRAYIYLGRPSDARGVWEQALEIEQRLLGAEHPDVARTLSNIANAYHNEEHYEESARLRERALGILENTLGPDHRDVAVCLQNLAVSYRRIDRGEEADRCYERALAILERTFGSEHFLVGILHLSIGTLRQEQRQDAEALVRYERALAILQHAVGLEHEHTLAALTSLGSFHAARGRLSEAEPLLARALAVIEENDDLKNAGAGATLLEMASLRKAQGRLPEAIAFYERALAVKERLSRDGRGIGELRATIEALRGEERLVAPGTQARPT